MVSNDYIWSFSALRASGLLSSGAKGGLSDGREIQATWETHICSATQAVPRNSEFPYPGNSYSVPDVAEHQMDS